MSLEEPLNYADIAAEILDELALKDIPLRDVVGRLEKACIRMALDNAKGNKARAARMLRMNRTTLQMRLNSIGMLANGGTE